MLDENVFGVGKCVSNWLSCKAGLNCAKFPAWRLSGSLTSENELKWFISSQISRWAKINQDLFFISSKLSVCFWIGESVSL